MAGAHVERSLHGLMGEHVHSGPVFVVLAAVHDGEINRSEALPKGLEVAAIAAVTAVQKAKARHFKDKPAPKGPVVVFEGAASKMP